MRVDLSKLIGQTISDIRRDDDLLIFYGLANEIIFEVDRHDLLTPGLVDFFDINKIKEVQL